MKLTTKSEYTLLALIFMARNYSQTFIKVEEICEQYNIPKKYLEQLFYILKNNGYIKTRRGAQGGYRLAKTPNKITVAEIIRLMDGPLAPIESVSKFFFSHTPLEKEKNILKLMKKIRNDIAYLLEKTKISDLID